MIKKKITFVLTGIVIVSISVYWFINSIYHLFNYDETLGYNQLTFGYGIPYYQIIMKFVFWLIMIISGLALIITNRIGLKLGLIGITISGFYCLIYALALTVKHLNYSTTILINQTERDMTALEKWEIIYSQPAKYWILFGSILTIFIMIRIRQKKVKNPAANKQSFERHGVPSPDFSG